MNISNVRKIIAHLNCSDGTASAMLLHDALPKAEVIFIQYKTPEADALQPEPGLLFCDFSPRDRIDEFLEAGAIVLDHHESVKDAVYRFVERDQGVFGDEKTSGALLAYRHVWRPWFDREGRVGDGDTRWKLAEQLAHLASVRDTWQTSHEHWELSCIQHNMLSFFSTDHWLNRSIYIGKNDIEWKVGEINYHNYRRKIEKCVTKNVLRTSWAGLNVAILSGGGAFVSDASEMLRNQGMNLCIGFFYTVEEGVPKICFSVRSDDQFDSASFAKFFGGGGHTKAVGLSLKATTRDRHPFGLVIDLLDEYSRHSAPPA
jgi:hypothetical protein